MSHFFLRVFHVRFNSNKPRAKTWHNPVYATMQRLRERLSLVLVCGLYKIDIKRTNKIWFEV